ncbi:hypothetical protein [Marinigracilibium pacificum]|uniref:Lipoprotein n=1 Tax=Marinigracilibium pacificum TaxID=2729599 RepID=A0A848J5B8_9BACT|nr:hypothetical protein [Marinigracilibium pacificum]NMM49549.1 hypothetical protein [Marinigracilibium pacificum]
MSKRLFFSLLAIVVTMSSCFNFKETIFLKKNGSGTYTFTIDMSALKPMMEAFQNMADSADSEADGEGGPTDMTKKFDKDMVKDKEILESVEGITNVESISDEDTFIFGLKFDFDNVNSLNTALNKMNKSENEDFEEREFFQYNKKSFERLNFFLDKGELQDELKDESDEDMSEAEFEQMMQMFGDMTYTTEYIFEEPVKDVSNNDALMTPDRKKVTIETKILKEDKKNSPTKFTF